MAVNVVDYVKAWDVTEAVRLRKLVGGGVVSRLNAEHPLYLGFAALRKKERGDELSSPEANALANLKLTSRTLFSVERSWKEQRAVLARQLGDSFECESILFELMTLRVTCKKSAAKVIWTRFLPGRPDIELHNPRLAVECKLIRSSEGNRLDAIRRAAKQHERLQLPLVVSVGVSAELTPREVEDVLSEAPIWREWFERHTRVAAGIIFSPMAPPLGQFDQGNMSGTLFDFGNVAVVRSRLAKPPLPSGYAFRGEDRTQEVPVPRREVARIDRA
jgi:hypothetical protein